MSSSSARNLLMIAYKFPPMHNTSCVRTWGFHQSIKPYFDTVTVISTSNRHLLRQEAVDMGDAEVYDAETYDYRTVLQKKDGKQSVVSNKSKQSFLGKFAHKLNASYPSLYIFGEGGVKYIRSAVKLGTKLINERSITHVFSTFPPYADHIIANELKEKFPSLYWIADFRDLHVDPTQDNMLFREQQRKWNKKILRHADIVTTVSSGLAQHLKELTPNVYVLMNGIDRMSGEGSPEVSDRFTISYTGSMFGEERNPDLLLKVLSELLESNSIPVDKLRVTYAGKDSAVWQEKMQEFELSGLFDDRGLISREEAIGIQQKSSINLLLTYSSPQLTGNITGKLFEYFNARRPVLVMINGTKDAEIEGLVPPELGRVVYNGNFDKVKEFVLSKYIEWKNSDTGESGIDYGKILEPFTWEHMTRSFADHIGLA